MKEKLIDFGRFGKWSKGTLKAQSSVSKFDEVRAPDSVRTTVDGIEKNIARIEELKVKKMNVATVNYNLVRLNIENADLKLFYKMRTLIRKLHTKTNRKV